MTNKEGKRCEGIVNSAKVETEGKLRSTLVFNGSFQTPKGKRIVDFRLRASVYSGLSQIYLKPQILINSDKDMIQYINELNLEFIPLNSVQSAAIGGKPGWRGIPASGSSMRLLQIDDENYRIEGSSVTGRQAPGWLEMNDGKGDMAITLRDFWQQWPKSIEVNQDVIKLGLLPKFETGTFDHMKPWYKHDYLFEGYCRSIREQRDYGAMNWGDWWGERQCNWGNHEYDTPLHIFTHVLIPSTWATYLLWD